VDQCERYLVFLIIDFVLDRNRKESGIHLLERIEYIIGRIHLF
jgi:hypothetical protein